MKSKLTNFISLAVVMFVLTAVFTVSALADITGGFGVIENLDNAKNYEAASVTINADGNGYAEGTAFELNDTTNKDLAGLYIVWEKGNKEATKTDILFVNGGFSYRQELSSTYEYQTGKFTVPHVFGKKDEWIVGTFTNPVYMHGNPSISGTVYSINNEFIPVTPQRELLDLLNAATQNQAAITAKQTEIATYLKTVSIRYAYNPEEIISANELKTLTFTVRVSQLRIGYKNATPAVTFKVLNKNGIVENYTWTSLTTYNSAYSDDATFAVDAATTLEGADGWVIGFEIFPVKELDPANVYHQTSAGSVYSNNTIIKVDTGATKYVIDKAAQAAPTGLTVDGLTVNGLDDSRDYVAIPVINGVANPDDKITISGVQSYTFEVRNVFDWDICYDETAEFAVSAPFRVTLPKKDTPTGLTMSGNTVSGFDADNSYVLVPFNINGADRANKIELPAGSTSYTFDPDTQSGLWAFYAKGDQTGMDSELSELICIYGKTAVRQKIGTFASEGADPANAKLATVGTQWVSGTFVVHAGDAYVNPNWISNRYAFRAQSIVPGAASKKVKDLQFNGGSDADLLKAKEELVPELKKVVTSYQYAQDEIIATKELLKFTFGLNRHQGPVEVVQPSVVFHVADKNGVITKYTWNSPEVTTGFTNGTEKKFEVDTTTVLPQTEGNWVVGFEIYTWGNISAEDITMSNNEHAFNLFTNFYHGENDYKITAPKADAPTGLTVEDTTVNGLDSATTYVAVPYNVNGADKANQIEIPVGSTSYTFDPATQAGLWGISIKGDEYNDNSEPSEIIYISLSSDARQEIGTFDSGSETPSAKARGEGEKWVEGQFILSSTLNKVNKESDGSYSLHQLYYGINKDNADVLALIEELNKETPDEAVVAEYKAKIYEKLADDYVTYAYNGEEIIPTGDLKQITIGLSKPQGFIGTFKPSVAFNVMDKSGEITEYIWNATEAQGGGTSTSAYKFVIDLTSILPQTEGNWVVGFEIRPWGAMTADEVQVPYEELEGNPYLNNDGQIKTHFYYGIDQYVIKADAPTPALSSFPLIAGGYGQISGLSPDYEYEYRYSDDDGATFTSWSDIPAGSTAMEVTAAGTYLVRAKNTATYGSSQIVEIVVAEYASLDADVLPYTQEITKIHLPNDFVELKAEYEMDLTAKKWVSTLALENIKALSPESTITIVGENHKIVITAANIVTDEKVHYYNMDVSLFGESRFNAADIEKYQELAGDAYVTDVYFESSNGLPFEEGQLMIKLGEKYDGLDVELNTYNDKINRLRLVEASTVYDGWVTFTNCDATYVIVLAD